MGKKQLSFLIFSAFLSIQIFTHSFDLPIPGSEATGYDSEIDELTSRSSDDKAQTKKNSQSTTPLHIMIAKSLQEKPQKELNQYFRYNLLSKEYAYLNRKDYLTMDKTQQEKLEYKFQIHISRTNNKIKSITDKIAEEKKSFIGIKAPLVDTTSQLEKELVRHQKESEKINNLYLKITGKQFVLPKQRIKKRSITRTSPVENFLRSTYSPIQPVNPQELNKLRTKYGILPYSTYQALNTEYRKKILNDFRSSSYNLLEKSNIISGNLAKEVDKKRKYELNKELQMTENELREICHYYNQTTGQTLFIKDNHFQILDA